jgi:ribosomal protein S18 acetylase RimI-like enzyme
MGATVYSPNFLDGVYSRKLGYRQLVLLKVGLVGAACTLYVILRCGVSGGESIQPRIRPFDDRDAEAVVDLSLRAWAPVFVSLEQALGSEIFRRQHPNWREDQRREVENVCAAKKGRVWVAEVGESVVGFVALELHHPERSMGEISMLAVDPDFQGAGIGTALTEFALDRLKDAGMTVATVETGGDPGHAAARRTYEKAGYVHLPIARYFKNL